METDKDKPLIDFMNDSAMQSNTNATSAGNLNNVALPLTETVDRLPKLKLEHMKQDLQGWREVLVPLNSVLNWEQQYYPAVLTAATSFMFILIWLFEPSVLTTLGLLGLTLSLLDFLLPLLAVYMFGTHQWTEKDERQFEHVCIRLLNCRSHFATIWYQINALKNRKPKLYLAVVMACFALLAWVGNMVDNLLVLYLVVLLLVLLPGLRQRGLLQQAWLSVSSQLHHYWAQIRSKAKKH